MDSRGAAGRHPHPHPQNVWTACCHGPRRALVRSSWTRWAPSSLAGRARSRWASPGSEADRHWPAAAGWLRGRPQLGTVNLRSPHTSVRWARRHYRMKRRQGGFEFVRSQPQLPSYRRKTGPSSAFFLQGNQVRAIHRVERERACGRCSLALTRPGPAGRGMLVELVPRCVPWLWASLGAATFPWSVAA